MYWNLDTQPGSIKLVEENKGVSFLISILGIFLALMLKAKAIKAYNQVELYQTKKLLHSKGNHQQNKSTTYQIGENTDNH